MTKIRIWALALAVFSAAMWFAWLAWDHEYYLVDGVAQGPYRAWQVIGCGGAIVIATVGAFVALRSTSALLPFAVAPVVGFGIPSIMDAAAEDETGMWGVAVIMLAVGGCGGLLVLLALTQAVMQAVAPRRAWR